VSVFLPSEIGPRVVYPPGCCRTRCNHDYLNILKRALSHTRNATKERKPLMRGERERKRVHCTHMCPHTFISKSPQTDGTPACLACQSAHIVYCQLLLLWPSNYFSLGTVHFRRRQVGTPCCSDINPLSYPSFSTNLSNCSTR
jgi:hypothetical protein